MRRIVRTQETAAGLRHPQQAGDGGFATRIAFCPACSVTPIVWHEAAIDEDDKAQVGAGTAS